jgi:hypothetical protein
MLDDNDMRRPCRALWDLAKTTQGRTSLPPVTVEASRAADALLRQLHGKPDYAPMADLLKVRHVNLRQCVCLAGTV